MYDIKRKNETDGECTQSDLNKNLENPWSACLRLNAFHSGHGILRWVDSTWWRNFFCQCMGSVPALHREESGKILICSGDPCLGKVFLKKHQLHPCLPGQSFTHVCTQVDTMQQSLGRPWPWVNCFSPNYCYNNNTLLLFYYFIIFYFIIYYYLDRDLSPDLLIYMPAAS